MFQWFALHFGIIFCLLNSPKCDLGEVERAMFQVVAKHFELIFYLLISPKIRLG